MTGPPEFVPLGGKPTPPEPGLPPEQQVLLEQIADPGTFGEDSVIGTIGAAVSDALHKNIALTQMMHEMNAAVQALIRRVDEDHKKLHQLEARIVQLENPRKPDDPGPTTKP